MPSFAEQFRDSLSSLGVREAPRYATARELATDVLRGDRALRRAIIQEIADADGIKYKSAEKRLQRYAASDEHQHRNASPAMFEQLQQRVQAVHQRRLNEVADRLANGVDVDVEMEIDPSPPGDEDDADWRYREFTVSTTPADMQPVTAALRGGDLATAARRMQQAALFAYGNHRDRALANAAVRNVERLDIRTR